MQNAVTDFTFTAGRCERPRPGHPQHLQRPPRLSHFLAHLRNHGSANVLGKILQGRIVLTSLLVHTKKSHGQRFPRK